MFGRHRRQYTKQITRSLNYILNNPKCFDLTQLCVVKGHHCWLAHVDISVSTVFFREMDEPIKPV
jgi:exosome complex RNA-binding protein Rrp42 (RNase PH superfamily)